MKSNWPFSDPENVVAFTVSDIAFGRVPILHVCHDEEDGGWQFLTGGPLPDQKDWMLVCLKNIVNADPTITELANLPLGWEANRTAVGHNWITKPQK